jgi:hypothetical protein
MGILAHVLLDCDAWASCPMLFTLQRKCGIGVPPMEKTNMAGTAMPLK